MNDILLCIITLTCLLMHLTVMSSYAFDRDLFLSPHLFLTVRPLMFLPYVFHACALKFHLSSLSALAMVSLPSFFVP